MIALGLVGDRMKRFVEGTDRGQSTLFPECLDDWTDENNPVRVIDAFVDTLDLAELGFEGVEPAETGRPAYHPSVLLKLYVYGYLNQVQSSRRLEREAGRNVELMWLLGRLVPDHKTVADFRKDNGPATNQAAMAFAVQRKAVRLSAMANGIPVRFLVDTGATMVAFPRAAAGKLGVDLKSSSVRSTASTADGTTYPSVFG